MKVRREKGDKIPSIKNSFLPRAFFSLSKFIFTSWFMSPKYLFVQNHCSKRILIFKEFFDPDCRSVWQNNWQNFGCFHSQCLFVEAVGRLRNVDEFHIRNGVIVTDHSTVLFLSVDNRRIALSRNGPNDVFVAGRSIHGFVISTFFLDTETNLW